MTAQSDSQEIIIVKVNGIEYKTHIVNGVQLFVSDPVIEALDKFVMGIPMGDSNWGFYNTLRSRFVDGEFTVDDMVRFDAACGRSVSFVDETYSWEFNVVDGRFAAMIENPLWDNQ